LKVISSLSGVATPVTSHRVTAEAIGISLWEEQMSRGGNNKKTDKQYCKELKLVRSGEYRSLEVYAGATTKIKHEHVACGYTWSVVPNNMLTGRSSCPQCSAELEGKNKRLTLKQVKLRVLEKCGSKIKVKQVADTGADRFQCLCTKCHQVWRPTIQNLLGHSSGCPNCLSPLTPTSKDYVLNGKVVRVQGSEPIVLDHLIEKGLSPRSLVVGRGKVPVITYNFSGEGHKYYPDIHVPDKNLVIEVKSPYTLGLVNKQVYYRDPKEVFAQNKAKARAAGDAGFRFRMAVVAKGQVIMLPKSWTKLKRSEVRNLVSSSRM